MKLWLVIGFSAQVLFFSRFLIQWIVSEKRGESLVPVWQQVEGVSKVSSLDGSVTLLVDDSNRVLPRLFESAGEVGGRITAVDIKEPNLESVFLHLTGRALRD